MGARLASGVAVSALIRRVQAAGGHAAVLARGDATAGAILLVLADRGRTLRLITRQLDGQGRYAWADAGPDLAESPPEELVAFLDRARSRDPDLWVIELDTPDGQRFADEIISEG